MMITVAVSYDLENKSKMYVQFCLDLQINVLLIKFWHSTSVNVCFSYHFRASLLMDVAILASLNIDYKSCK